MAELDSDSMSSMIHRLVKQLLGQRCAAWRHACGHRSRDLLLLCSCKQNEIMSVMYICTWQTNDRFKKFA